MAVEHVGELVVQVIEVGVDLATEPPNKPRSQLARAMRWVAVLVLLTLLGCVAFAALT